jgi:hypothetical protein
MKRLSVAILLAVLTGCQSEYVTVGGVKMPRAEAREREALAGKCAYPPGYNGEGWKDLGLPPMRNVDGSLYCAPKVKP